MANADILPVLKADPGKGLDRDDIHSAALQKLRFNRRYMDDELRENWRRAYGYYKGIYPTPTSAHDSTVTSTDVSDTIEWILPSVLKPMVESPDVVRFDPVNPEDASQAELESDYVHHVFMKKCDGFVTLYNHIKDALLLKNAIFCTYWDEGFTHQKESYTGLSEIELADLLHPSDGSKTTLLASKTREVPLTDVVTGQPVPDETYSVFDVDIRRYWPKGQPKVENCVPEQFKVDFSHGALSLRDARWCSYTMRKVRADLIALGYDEDLIDQIPLGAATRWDNEVRWAREDVERSANQFDDENDTPDPSQDIMEIHRTYMRLDVDGDGLEEHWMIILGGFDGQVMLDYYEVPENPFSASTPFIMAHKFYGSSIYDKLKNLADHKTKVLRMLEDNLDLVNHPPKEVARGRVTLDDVLVRQTGAIYRSEEVGSIREIPIQPIHAQAQQLLDYYDKMRSERSGTDPNAQSISSIMPEESMNHAMERVISMKEELVGLIIRVFAETGVKDMFLKLRGVLMRNMEQSELVQLRNKWVTINPGNWTERTDTTTLVGLGTGDRIRKTQGLNTILNIQLQAREQGLDGVLVSPQRLAYTITELVRVQGLGDPDDFVLDPSLLLDPRNAETPRGKEMVQALQLQQMQAQQAAQAEQAKMQAQQQQQEALLNLQRELEQMRQEGKVLTEQLRAQQGEKDRLADMMQFFEQLKLDWAKLRAEETAEQDQFVLNAAKNVIEDKKASQSRNNGGGE